MMQEPIVEAKNVDVNIDPSGFSIENLTGYALEYGVPLLKAILIYIIGAFIIKKLVKLVSKLMDKRDYDLTLKKFLTNLIKWV
ncbi:mechanosensitive ion channel family protein, partial [Nonlabens ulvanivorans]